MTLLCSASIAAFALEADRPLSVDQRDLRLQNAHELLGKYYAGSAVRVGENIAKINGAIYRWTREKLPGKYKKSYQKIAQTIVDESLKYELDPVLLMSIISSESSFNPDQLGKVGEIGLMQIRPSTGKWIAEKFDLKWHGKRTLYDPVNNIRIGAAYLNYLRDRFDLHATLYLAAYNMGQANVDNLKERKVWPKIYPLQVMRSYIEFYTALKERERRSVARS